MSSWCQNLDDKLIRECSQRFFAVFRFKINIDLSCSNDFIFTNSKKHIHIYKKKKNEEGMKGIRDNTNAYIKK